MPEQPAPTPAEPAAREQTLSKAARKHLTRELGWTPRATPPVPAADLEPRATRLPAEVRAELVALLGEDQVADDRETRLRHTGGTSYLDRLRRRQGDASDAPDAVLTPADTEQTAAVLALCSDRGVVVVPWGGGTSTVGGLPGTDTDDRPVVVLDLARMDSVRALDVPSSLVTVGPGMRAAALADALRQHGGHTELALSAYDHALRPFVEEAQATALVMLSEFLIPQTEAGIQKRNAEGIPF